MIKTMTKIKLCLVFTYGQVKSVKEKEKEKEKTEVRSM
jgi:hypothetical protein